MNRSGYQNQGSLSPRDSIERRMDKWVQTGRQLVDGVAGNRPGQRRKENRRYEDNPGIKVKMRQKMLLAIDTSGSVNNEELAEFMNEIYHIYKSGVAIEIIQCDTKINSIEEYKGKFELEIRGRGGTDFDPVLEYYMKHRQYTSLIYFTDGEAYTDFLQGVEYVTADAGAKKLTNDTDDKYQQFRFDFRNLTYFIDDDGYLVARLNKTYDHTTNGPK